MKTLTTEDINNRLEHQLACWPLAKSNFDALMKVERKALPLGDFNCCAQFNPARIVSTAAKTDPDSIRKRKCFLCAENRPEEQFSEKWIEGWELLVNPYPILPVHFTIVDTTHTPQGEIPFEMAQMAEMAPDLAIFYNGARAGASAPDHRHCQGVLKSELPLVALAEKCHRRDMPAIVSSEEFGSNLPFQFLSAIVTPDENGMLTLMRMIRVRGIDSANGKPNQGLVNAFFWIGNDGLLRIAAIPRRAHRPSCFFKTEEEKMTVSPGALDMAGMLILPVHKDFLKINEEMALEIYSEVAFADSLPNEVIP